MPKYGAMLTARAHLWLGFRGACALAVQVTIKVECAISLPRGSSAGVTGGSRDGALGGQAVCGPACVTGGSLRQTRVCQVAEAISAQCLRYALG